MEARAFGMAGGANGDGDRDDAEGSAQSMNVGPAPLRHLRIEGTKCRMDQATFDRIQAIMEDLAIWDVYGGC